MSSKEIADLTGKSLGHIHRDFKVMISELGYGTPSNPFVDLDDTPLQKSYSDIINISEVSRIVGIARKTIYKHINNGKLIRSNGGIHKDELNRVYGIKLDSCKDGAELDSSGFTYVTDGSNRITSILMNQELTMTLVSGYNVKLRNAIVKRWQELESKSQNQSPTPKIPANFAEALQLAADQAKQLELAAPKVAFVDNLVDRKNLMTATQVASKHGMSAVKLNRVLDEVGGVYNKSVKRGRVFIQSFIDSGYGEVKQTEQGYSQALFTPSGEVYINEKLISEGVI